MKARKLPSRFRLPCANASTQNCEYLYEYTLDTPKKLSVSHHPQILHCLKDINYYGNVYERLRALHAHACTYRYDFFWCILVSYLTIVPSLIKIWVHLTEKFRCVTFSKLGAHFHTLCVYARTCMQTNIINQLRRPRGKFVESFVKIWFHIAEILRCVTWVKKRDSQTHRQERQTDLKFSFDCYNQNFRT